MIDPYSLKPILEKLLLRAAHYGAEQADAIATQGRSLAVRVRGGALEDIDNSEGRDIGLRVIIGKRQACVSTSDLSDGSLDLLAERAAAMARLAPEDPYCGLAPEALLEKSPRDLQLCDPVDLTPEALQKKALEIERAAAAVPGVTQAEGSSANCSKSAACFMTSAGFIGGWASSRHGLSSVAIATEGGQMERDYDAHDARWLSQLPAPEHVGRKAGERAVARLGARQIASTSLPVMFDRRVAGSLVSILLGAINGNAIARGTSFLKDRLGETIADPSITLMDDPLIARGHASRPWDGEGVRAKPLSIIEDGVLKTWLLNCPAALQLDMTTTGHAYRPMGAPPGIAPSNSYIKAGGETPEALLEGAGDAILITDMFGPSFNPNNGDYSVGISGFKIEGGARAFPVNEITVAGNITEMLLMMTPASDLKLDEATSAPSLFIDQMTIAGLS